MVDSMIPEDRNTKELQNVANEREAHKLTYPNFLENAERINVEQQDYLVSARRAFKNSKDNIEKIEKGMVYAIGEEVTIWQVNGEHIPMLKMRVEENDAAVYVPLPEIGANYRHSASYIGQRKKVVLGDFTPAGQDELGNPLYIAYASILGVENTLGEIIYNQFQTDPDSVKNQDRLGIITEVVATGSVNMIFFDYQGISLTMLERDYHFKSYLHPLEEDARVGDKIKFRITNIIQDDFSNMESVKEDQKLGRLTPTGKRYYIQTTRLPYLPSPDARVIKLAQQHSYFLARVYNWNPIKGVTVQIAPGWIVKGFITPGSHIRFSQNDVIKHTKVVVTINYINTKNRSGQVYIRSTPEGVAPKTPDMDLSNEILAQQNSDGRKQSQNPVRDDDSANDNDVPPLIPED